MSAIGFVRRILGDESGNALFIAAASMPLLIGSAGMAVDTVHISLTKRQLQRSADSAAIAGARGLAQNRTAAPSVTRDLQLNNDIPLTGTPQVGVPTTGPFAGSNQAVRVRLSASRALSFFGMFGRRSQPITVEATAAVILDGPVCVRALDPGNVTGITFAGNSRNNFGCGISANARSASAITADGSATVNATPVMAVGGIPASGAYAAGTTFMPHAAEQEDPFAGVPLPSPTNCQNELKVQPGGPGVLPTNIGPDTPGGSMCFKGMDIKGTLNLAPGVYYIDGSTGKSLSFGSQANITGTDVTFVLTSTTAATNPASIATTDNGDINGRATLNLTAPTSGPFAKILFYEDPRAPIGRQTTINGSATSSLEGALYFPRSYVTFSGTQGMQTRCLQIVARRLHFTGNSQIENQCTRPGGAEAFRASYVRLVG